LKPYGGKENLAFFSAILAPLQEMLEKTETQKASKCQFWGFFIE
jgi:hypothetical protein